MTNKSNGKIDLNIQRSKEKWKILLDAVKRNDSGILTKDEQSFYVGEIEFKITGQRFNREDIIKDIADGAADIDDIG